MVNDDDEDTSKDKEIDKLMALISLSFKKIYKPTNNNLHTSSNTSRANQDNSPRIHRNAGYEGQRSGTVAGVRDTVGSSMDNSPRIHRNARYEGQRSGIVAGTRDTVGSLMVQKYSIQCYNCKEYGHIARECQKPKRAKDAAYHREKMLLYAQSMLMESENTSYDSDQIDQNDEDVDLAKELIVDDYSRYTWTHFLRSKDETPEVLIDFLRLVQRGHQAQVRVVRTDKGTEFLNLTLHAYFAAEGIHHQTSVARTPEQNGVVERRNRTLVEAARTMLSAAKVPLFFWAEAIATACFTQNRSLVIPRHEKTTYHIINERKPFVKFFHIFGFVCYIVRDGENLDKMKEKGDECIFVGYSTQSRAYRVFNKRTNVIMESIHVNFDELPTQALVHNSTDPALKRQEMASVQNRTDPGPTCQKKASSSAVSAADAPNQRQQPTTPLNTHTTPVPTCPNPPITTTVISSENIKQAKPHAENDQVADDEFINIFSNPIYDQGE
nr:retrovirus-related Pol polyprotein from transposon TNT 1-94 [Tanacetum cinerariifolium]